jgi:lipid-binding SYLF domain-containing protein
MKTKNLLMLALTVIFLSSCSARLVDFTVISSKNHSIKFNMDEGKVTKGKSMGVFAIGANIKDAMDAALENAGPQYDVLVNGVVRSKSYPFYGGFEVEGTAVNSRKLIAQLGREGYEKWLSQQVVFNPEKEKNLN